MIDKVGACMVLSACCQCIMLCGIDCDLRVMLHCMHMQCAT